MPNSSDQEAEAKRLKSLAETKYKTSGDVKLALNLAEKALRLSPDLAGLRQLITALHVLSAPQGNHYRALLVEPFSDLTAVRRQYKSLALILHPDKNPSFSGSALAFDRVAEAFRVLSEHRRRKRFDSRLRKELEAEKEPSIAAEIDVDSKYETLADMERKIKRGLNKRDRGNLKFPPSLMELDEERQTVAAVEIDVDRRDQTLADMQKEIKQGLNKPAQDNFEEERRISVAAEVESDSGDHQTLAEMQKEIKRELLKKQSRDGELMAVEDSDFYDFDEGRTERCFRKGQVWAVYDEDDGMPRLYCRVSEVSSMNPFKLTMNWLDQSNWQFKIGNQIEIESVNLFSHLVDCERAAREIYRIFPRKGSVWALYKEEEENNYDIVVVLSGFREGFGLAMAYLEKVKGFKSVFKRREVGAHAVRLMEKCDQQLLSHQIPARKLSGKEMKGFDGDCWELDPASLPASLLAIEWNPR